MNAERWQHVKTLLDQALDHAVGEQRTTFLAEACAGDAALRAEVESLLAAHDGETAGFLSAGAFGEGGPRAAEAALDEDARVGPYRLAGVLGRGGMGTVYRAVRDDAQYERKVALKVIRPGLSTGEAVRRFQAERQILASLEHPHIARLYDGGLTDDGRPYFAMERVEGTAIDRYCDAKRLSVDARLRLFETVAESVAYAHRKLVVHRDLKPSNILITAEGEPKLLDFGIAKLLAAEADAPGCRPAAAPLTRTGQHLMTPEYAAPEQVRSEAITPATDVYALGALLYQLLTGRRPYRFEKHAPSHVEQVICETQPARPSTVVTRAARDEEAATSEHTSRARSTEPGRLKRALKGDLDRIVMKALRKEPERRYASAAELAEDLRRYREGLPVKARPSTLRYRTGKFARRHRWGVAAAAVLVLLLAGYAATVSVQARRLAAERDRAQVEAQKAEQVSKFLTSLFEDSDPYEAQTGDFTVHELLERGVERVDALKGQPAVQAQMLYLLGKVHERRGRYAQAKSLQERSLALRRRLQPSPQVEIAENLNSLAILARQEGNHAKADSLHRRVLAMRRRLLGDEHAQVASSMSNLAVVLDSRGQYAASDSLYRRALAIQHRLYEGDHRDIAQTLDNIAVTARHRGRYEEAVRLQRRALAMRKRLFTPPHAAVARSLHNLARVLNAQGKPEAADSLYRQSLAMSRALYDGPHLDIAQTLNNIGMIYGPRGQLEKAEPFLRQALAMRRKIFPEGHPQLAGSLNNLGALFIAEGRYEDARPLLQEALSIDRKKYGPHHPYVGGDLHNLGRISVGMREWKTAGMHFHQALEVYDKSLPPDHPKRAATLIELGELQMRGNRAEKAEPLLRRALRIRQQALPAAHWQVAEAQSVLGACLTHLRAYAEADSLLNASYKRLRRKRDTDDAVVRQTAQRLTALYDSWAKPEQAAAWRDSLAAAKNALATR